MYSVYTAPLNHARVSVHDDTTIVAIAYLLLLTARAPPAPLFIIPLNVTVINLATFHYADDRYLQISQPSITILLLMCYIYSYPQKMSLLRAGAYPGGGGG